MNGTPALKRAIYVNNGLVSNILHQSHSIRSISTLSFQNQFNFGHNGYHLNNAYNLNNNYIFNSHRNETSRAKIDEVLLSKQEDPMVLKQKEELLRAFAAQLSKSLKRFESSKKMRLKFLLKTIYGCTTIEIKQYCAMFGIHEQTSVKDVPPLFWAGKFIQKKKKKIRKFLNMLNANKTYT